MKKNIKFGKWEITFSENKGNPTVSFKNPDDNLIYTFNLDSITIVTNPDRRIINEPLVYSYGQSVTSSSTNIIDNEHDSEWGDSYGRKEKK